MSTTIATRLAGVNKHVAEVAERAGRDPSEVTVIAVGKTFSADVVADAVRAGATQLGENRVQEAVEKKPQVPAATWHLIGPLQRNKVRPALTTFDVVHTLDRPELAERLQRLLSSDWPDRVLRTLIEVNIGDEPQKAGVSTTSAAELLDLCLQCDQLQVEGLMAIPPFGEDPEASRPLFASLRKLRNRLQDDFSHPLPQLSMGMSADYPIAIQEGATMVRVGTAIFGSRY